MVANAVNTGLYARQITRFYDLVPKELEANLRYRLAVRRRALKDMKFRTAVWQACAKDVLYFFNTFLWVYEPRPEYDESGKQLPMMRPFITWENQDPFILSLRENLGKRDIVSEKSRGLGASWIACGLAEHDLIFSPKSSPAKISFVSRSMEACDDPQDMDSLFAKVDWSMNLLPSWMWGQKGKDWKRNLSRHTLTNLKTGSTLAGYGATGEVGRGGRSNWFFKDEMASWPFGRDESAMKSTQHVTNSRWVNSTPKGRRGKFAEMAHDESPSHVRLRLDWKETSKFNRGLYRFEKGGKCVVLDENNPLPEGYAEESRELFNRLRSKGFRLVGTIRSPWYDRECDRSGATPQAIAQELDMDYSGSQERVFTPQFEVAAKAHVRPYQLAGDLRIPATGVGLLSESEFFAQRFGRLKLWMPLNTRMEPRQHRFVIGCDVAAGTSGSNSVAAILDVTTKEQVGEYTNNTMQPVEFADYCMALGYWLHNAFIIWEGNGPGSTFTNRVLEMSYANLYRRRKSHLSRSVEKTHVHGWWTDDKTKEILFSTFDHAVREGELVLRSDDLVQETSEYIRDEQTGKIVHEQKIGLHGDRVVAMALCQIGVKDRYPYMASAKRDVKPEYPPGSMGHRMDEWDKREKANKEEVWDDRSTAELGDRYDIFTGARR